MAEKVFDRETLLDLTVNVIPLAILAIFFAAFVVFTPFGFDSVISSIQLAIIGLSAVGLAVLTYFSGRAVSKAENAQEEASEIEPAEDAAPDTTESRE
jgi:threonine/homoserine/homoserine lactone efflux protein